MKVPKVPSEGSEVPSKGFRVKVPKVPRFQAKVPSVKCSEKIQVRVPRFQVKVLKVPRFQANVPCQVPKKCASEVPKASKASK